MHKICSSYYAYFHDIVEHETVAKYADVSFVSKICFLTPEQKKFATHFYKLWYRKSHKD